MSDEHEPRDPGSDGTGAVVPSLPARLFQVLFSPGRLCETLAGDPRWLGALLVSTILVSLQLGLIPADVFASVQRQALLEAGREVPAFTERALRMIRIFSIVAPAVFSVIMTFLLTGLYSVMFAFILGDEGRYRQYLAVVTHAAFIPALIGLLLTPLRVFTGDPQLTLNMGSFMFFLSEGYLLNIFRVLDLTQIWSMLIVAQGAHSIDPRRSFKSAAVILLSVLFALALLLARFLPT